MSTQRMEERKARDRQARRAQIVRTARQIAADEGWPSVTIRRLSDEISYSQPVLYSHFAKRDDIVTAVAIEGFQELGLALEKARQRSRRSSPLEAPATAYLEFASGAPALYEAMFSLLLKVPFADPSTPPELHFAFAQVLALFPDESADRETMAEIFWASLHGIAELTRTRRFPPQRQKDRVRALVKIFSVGTNTKQPGGSKG